MAKYKSQLPRPSSSVAAMQVVGETKDLRPKKLHQHKQEDDKDKDDAFLITFNIEKTPKQAGPAKLVLSKELTCSSIESGGQA